MTLLIGTADAASVDARPVQLASPQSLAERVQELVRDAQMDRKEALKVAAKERGLSRRAAYEQMIASRSQAEKTWKPAGLDERLDP